MSQQEDIKKQQHQHAYQHKKSPNQAISGAQSESVKEIGPIPNTPQVPSAEDAYVADGDIFTQLTDNHSTIQFDPVIKKGIAIFEILVLKSVDSVGIADESERYNPGDYPHERDDGKNMVEYGWEGDTGRIFNWGDENEGFKVDDRVTLELNMDSNPRTLTFFKNDVEQPTFVTNIPAAVRFWVCIAFKDDSFKVLKFESISAPVAKHGADSIAWDFKSEKQDE
ncbi:MAG: hypothetical protein EZS28_010067 [Streblomastix strix]|uniref:B30.2/SPRY domain-containing protein n=1 Tax=Streblomastix strix TaxID=222440 RepID=A0A5J4WJ73_9EUKA|nr:MAG: hypothetical protein EZS28_010067 [Streblomastix strix]